MNEVETMTSPSPGSVEIAKYYLHPGQWFATNEPVEVTTILGSCVAVCLWDTRSQVAGINHYMLPYWSSSDQASPRFGNVAVEQLIKRVLALGAKRERLKAKLFGGACVLEAFTKINGDLGAKNVEVARHLLYQNGIPIIAEDVGGDFGRKLIFSTLGGAVRIKTIDRL
jgi:chemotaxis protein CheD